MKGGKISIYPPSYISNRLSAKNAKNQAVQVFALHCIKSFIHMYIKVYLDKEHLEGKCHKNNWIEIIFGRFAYFIQIWIYEWMWMNLYTTQDAFLPGFYTTTHMLQQCSYEALVYCFAPFLLISTTAKDQNTSLPFGKTHGLLPIDTKL